MKKNIYILLFLVSLLVSLISLNPHNVAYGHNFTPNESASFLSFVDQLLIESQLVQSNLANNRISLAQQHANNAAILLTPNITKEIAEENQRVADDLMRAINDLQNISSTSQRLQFMDELVSDIDAILGEAVTTRIEREQRDNAAIQALALANIADNVLINYGNAFAVDFDMTNMSNMAMMGGNSSSDMMTMSDIADDDNNSNSTGMNMDLMNMSSPTMMNMNNKMNGNYSLVDITDYQSAQALAAKALENFQRELKPMAPNNSSAFITNLESGLSELSNAIGNKASPLDIMMIVHTQIHPNLLQGFELDLR